MPYTIRTPRYHWMRLELRRCFGITELLHQDRARRIWEQTPCCKRPNTACRTCCASWGCK